VNAFCNFIKVVQNLFYTKDLVITFQLIWIK